MPWQDLRRIPTVCSLQEMEFFTQTIQSTRSNLDSKHQRVSSLYKLDMTIPVAVGSSQGTPTAFCPAPPATAPNSPQKRPWRTANLRRCSKTPPPSRRERGPGRMDTESLACSLSGLSCFGFCKCTAIIRSDRRGGCGGARRGRGERGRRRAPSHHSCMYYTSGVHQSILLEERGVHNVFQHVWGGRVVHYASTDNSYEHTSRKRVARLMEQSAVQLGRTFTV